MASKSKAAFTLYHNPRCSKSRATLELLAKHAIEPLVVEYLKTPFTAGELKALLEKLDLQPSQLVRKNEPIYQALFADSSPTEARLLTAMVENPVLIERPIVVKGRRAVIGRPPENVLQLLK